MTGLRAYLELKESGTENRHPRQHVSNHPKAGIQALLKRAEEQGTLGNDGPWILSQREARALENETRLAPPGGWVTLASTAASGGFLEVESRCMTASIPSEEASLLSFEDVRLKCLHGFTQWLAPPAAAAGLFVCIGLHPMWGLRLVQSIDSPFCRNMPWGSDSPEHTEQLDAISRVVFGTISAFFGALRSLDPDLVYPIDALPGLLVESCRCARELMGHAIQPGDGLPVFVMELPDPNRENLRRVADVAITDLLDGVLVPCGAARRYEEGVFQMMPGALDEVVVGTNGVLEQEAWLGWLTTVEPRFLVA